MNDNHEKFNIYEINTKPQYHKKRIVIVLSIIVIIIGTIGIYIHSIKIIKNYKIYKGYEAQLIKIQKEEEEKIRLAEIEQERLRQEKIPKLTEIGKQNIEEIYKSETKRVFLTFDDGPSGITPEILDILKQEDVKATFFVLGSQVEIRPDIVKRAYEEGHYIANHGYSHKYSEIYASPESVLNEINKCNEIIRLAIGVPEYNSYLFRYPGGFVRWKICQHKKRGRNIIKRK